MTEIALPDLETIIVIPCYNEAGRLDLDSFSTLATTSPQIHLLFVDDGSTDSTYAELERLADRAPQKISTLRLGKNQGKAEAVRVGMLNAMGRGAQVTGYLDADLATPPVEMLRLVSFFSDPGLLVVFGSRIQMLGTTIERKGYRHAYGRFFAYAAAQALAIGIHDTQCGAKCFRRHDTFLAALERPFHSRWIFDVELFGRLLYPGPDEPPLSPKSMREEPLRIWRDIKGSKVNLVHAATAFGELVQVARQVRRSPFFRNHSLPFSL